MRKSVKKLVSILCASAMLLTLAGCSGTTGGGGQDAAGGSNGGGTSSGGNSSGGNSSSGTKDVNVLTWSNEATVVFLKGIAEDFHNKYPEYNLVVTEVPSGEIDSVIQTRIIAGDVDVVSFQTFSKPQEEWNASSIDKPAWQDYIDQGLLTDLTDQDFIKNYNLDTLMGNAYNDRIYSLNIGTVGYGGMFYNKKIFEELNLEVPKTWDELMKICETVQNDGRYSVISAGAGDQWPLNIFSYSIISANYGEGTKEFGQKLLTGEIRHTDPEAMLVYNCMEQIATYLEDGVSGISYSDAPGRFALGNMAMYIDGTWSWADIDKAGPDFEYGYFACPPVEARSDGLVPQDAIKYDLSFSVPTNAPNSEGALAFLDYISQKDVYSDFINAIGFTPTQNDIQMENPFLNSMSEILQKPTLNAEMLIYAPKGVGEYGGGQFTFFYLKELGGDFDAQGLAEAADEDFDTARKALESMG